ncbi:replication protein [Klebsiella oxytoca]|uniref:replication protein n=1 Tax=Klebsiella oxytoca TaxID=571 RepID=UPI0007CBCFD5|nr:replication protein [Klebsiella oxytoca]EGT0047571.1 phage replication protein [Klebsiella oxytoca]ELR0729164.1 replication protein [Klebsiella oxytoca]MDM4544141.1 replication protein [Klebsiella oxytoca]MDT9801598.1 replication protein [Klebsiella oxytoca]MEC5326924.1 replication protein [Klebsiella oxytoca]
MANTAKVIKFPAQQPAQQENRMADLENGYLRLANQIQDALCFVELSGREFRVLNAIVRLTYGWSKKEDRITNSLIADKTRLAVKHVSEAVLSLAYRNIIKMRRIGQTRYIGINTLLDGWAYTKPKCAKCPVSFPVAEVVTQVITIPEIGDSKVTTKTIPKNGDNHPQNQGEVSLKTGNTKDILPKTNIKTDLTPIVPTGDEWEKPVADEVIQDEPQADPVRQVFSHWQTEHHHLSAKLDDKRRKRIKARLAEGFTADELCRAISGAKGDSWLMGKNPSKKRYDGIDTLLRDAAQVERLRDLAGDEHAMAVAQGQYSATTARNLETLQRWAGGTDSGELF